MPQLVPLSPKGADTQVVQFDPLEVKPGGTSVLTNRENGVVATQKLLYLSLRPSSEGGTNKMLVTTRLILPVIRQVEGIDTAVDAIIAKVDFRFPNVCTTAERQQALALISSIHNGTDVPELTDFYENLKSLY